MNKRALLIRARITGEQCEIDAVACALSAAEIVPVLVDLTQDAETSLINPLDQLLNVLIDAPPFDFVYLCAARGDRWFGDQEIGLEMCWKQLSMILCMHVAEESTVFLASGKSGLGSVSHALFDGCDDVETIVAPKFDATWRQSMTAATTFVHHVFACGSDPDVAVAAASVAANTTFQYRDRTSTIETLEFRDYQREQEQLHEHDQLAV